MAVDWKKRLVGEFSLRRLALSLVEIYLLVMIAGYLISDHLIFCPQEPAYRLDEPGFFRIAVDGQEQIAMFEEPGPPDAPAVLYIHGNAEDIGDLRPFFQDYAARGFRVFSFDYRGYGRSDGKAGTRHASRDAEAAYQYLVKERGVAPDRLIIHGRSVGAAFGIELAAAHPVGGLVVQSGFVSAFRTLTRYPLFPLDKLRSGRTIRRVTCPVLVIHGSRDSVIPPWHGQALYDAARSPKSYYGSPDAGHDDVAEAGGEYWTRLSRFGSMVDGRTNSPATQIQE
jgi:pimeloyl-ACP methyl ester carboxylesterase